MSYAAYALCALLLLAGGAFAKQQHSLSTPAPTGLLIVSNPTEPVSGQPLTRPLGQVWGASSFVVSNNPDYPFAHFDVTVNNPAAGTNDYIVIAAASTPGTPITSPWYLNNSSTPPGTVITNATLQVPSILGLQWNANYSSGVGAPLPTPVTTNYVLQLHSGGSTIASVNVKIDTLKRVVPDFQRLTHYLINSPVPCDLTVTITSGSTGGTTALIVSGASVGVQALNQFACSPIAHTNALTLQYTVDDVDVGLPVTGPPTGGVNYNYPTTINSTTLADGTHSICVRVIDYTGGDIPPYYFRCGPNVFISMNSSSIGTFYNTARTIPVVGLNGPEGPDNRFNSSAYDAVIFPGLPSVSTLHQTGMNIPTPQAGIIPPATNSSSPYFSNPAALREHPTLNSFQDNLPGPIATEYAGMQRFFTQPGGGVFAFHSYPEDVQSLEGNYAIEVTKQPYDGARDDNISSNISSSIEGRDPTNANVNLRSFWLAFEATGRITRMDYSGAITTLAGLTLNRSLLPYPVYPMPSYGTLTESDYDTRLTSVGTIDPIVGGGPASFGDLRGMNDGRYDPADSTFNRLYVANTLNQDIVLVTHLIDGTGAHMVRIAGQDAGLAGSSNSANHFLGDFQDGVATEFIDSGTTTATFTGAINGTTGVLTISGTYTGSTNLKACPIKWSGHTVTANGTLITTNISGSGTGSTWNTNYTGTNVSAIAMTATGCVALFNRPYSLEVSDGSAGLDPAGTIYVADTGNHRLRKIDTSGNVTTLFGNQANTSSGGFGVMLPDGANTCTPSLTACPSTFGPFTISAWSWSSGLLSLTTTAPIQQTTSNGFSQTYTISHWWTVGLNGTGNVNLDGNQFSVNSVSSCSTTCTFTLWVPNNPSLGTVGGTVTAYLADIFAPTDGTYHLWNHGSANELYFPDIQRIVWSSANPGLGSTSKHLIAGGPWLEAVYDIDIATTQMRTIGALYSAPNSRARFSSLGSNASNGEIVGHNGISQASPSWLQIDVDNTGCCGPLNDILISQSSASLDDYFWRLSFDGTSWTNPWGNQNNGQQSPLRFSPLSGGGHYPWTASFSRTQGRIMTSGTSDLGLFQARNLNPVSTGGIDVPADPTISGSNLNVDTASLTRALSFYSQGSIQHWVYSDMVGFFPWGSRPSLWQLHGSVQNSQLGLTSISGTACNAGPCNTDSWDALNANFPTDAALTTFLQNGAGGSVPRPELTGEDLSDMLYFIRRSSIGGSLVSSAGALPQRAAYQTDVTAPVISNVHLTRASPTSVTMTWDTDKPTYGFAACGFASGQAVFTQGTFPYHMWQLEAWGGSALASYKTTGHSVTISHLSGNGTSGPGFNVTTFCKVYAKDIAGNNQVSSQLSVP